MKTIFSFILIFTFFTITNVFSNELVLTENNCEDKMIEEFNFDMESGEYIIYLCDSSHKDTELSSIISYFFEDPCPNEYKELPDIGLILGEDDVNACNPLSMNAINKNLDHYNRVRFYSGKCPYGEIELINTDIINGCLLE